MKEKQTTLAVVLVFLFFLPTFNSLAGSGTDGPDARAVEWPELPGINPPEPSTTIWFKTAAFDPLERIPSFPPGYNDPQGPYRLMQFDGPVPKLWREELEGAGVTFLWYIPDNAFVVRVDGQNAEEALHQHPNVRWNGPVWPGLKLHPDLRGFTGDIAVNIHLYDVNGAKDVVTRVSQLGGVLNWEFDGAVNVDIPSGVLPLICNIPEVGWVEPGLGKIKFHNSQTTQQLKLRQSSDGAFADNGQALWSYNPGSGTFEGAAGDNVIVAVADSGIENHSTFDEPEGKRVWYKDYNDPEKQWEGVGTKFDHGVGCAGIAVGCGKGSGANRPQAGMAPNAKLIGQAMTFPSVSMSTLKTIHNDAVNHGADISSNSWSEDLIYEYDMVSNTIDKFINDAYWDGDEMCYFFATGNDGTDKLTSAPSNAKNVIAVGATTRFGTSMAPFSQGRTDNGRIKPEVVTPGQGITTSAMNDGWTSSFQGTSAACPAAAGAGAAVMDYYIQNRGLRPSPALLKCLLVSGAKNIGTTAEFPRTISGFGMIDTVASTYETSTRKFLIQDQEMQVYTGTSTTTDFDVDSSDPLKVLISWSDYEGVVSAADPMTNNLDLKVTSPSGTVYWGNDFDGLETNPDGQADDRDNIEAVYLNSPETGKWTIEVLGTNVPWYPQTYALLVRGPVSNLKPHIVDMGIDGNVTVTGSNPIILEGDTVTVSWDVINLGNISTGSFDYSVFRYINDKDSEILHEGRIDDLAPGATVNVSGEWEAVEGTYIFGVEVDTSKEVFELLELNNRALSGDIVVETCRLDVTRSGLINREVDPGGTASFNVTMTNTGSIQVNSTVNAYPLAGVDDTGWTITVSTPDIYLAPGNGTKVQVKVEAPADSLAGQTLDFEVNVSINAFPPNHPFQPDALTFTATVSQVFKTASSIDNGQRSGLPGEAVQYNITVDNTGNGPDTISLAVSNVNNYWSDNLNVSSVVLDVGGSTPVSLKVTVPNSALAGEWCLMKFTATPSEKGVVSEVMVNTTALPFYDMVLDNFQGDITAGPGEVLPLPLALENGGNIEDEYSVVLDLPSGWESLDPPLTMSLGPSEMQVPNFNVSVPVDTLAGLYTIDAVVSNSKESRTVTFNVTVDQLANVSVTGSFPNGTAVPGDTLTLMFDVQNNGNFEDTLSMSTTGLPAAWTISYTPGSSLVMEPWTSTEVTVTITVPTNAIEETRDVTFTVLSETDNSISDTYAFPIHIHITSTGDDDVDDTTDDTDDTDDTSYQPPLEFRWDDKTDTDHDGVPDAYEVFKLGTDPQDPDDVTESDVEKYLDEYRDHKDGNDTSSSGFVAAIVAVVLIVVIVVVVLMMKRKKGDEGDLKKARQADDSPDPATEPEVISVSTSTSATGVPTAAGGEAVGQQPPVRVTPQPPVPMHPQPSPQQSEPAPPQQQPVPMHQQPSTQPSEPAPPQQQPVPVLQPPSQQTSAPPSPQPETVATSPSTTAQRTAGPAPMAPAPAPIMGSESICPTCGSPVQEGIDICPFCDTDLD